MCKCSVCAPYKKNGSPFSLSSNGVCFYAHLYHAHLDCVNVIIHLSFFIMDTWFRLCLHLCVASLKGARESK